MKSGMGKLFPIPSKAKLLNIYEKYNEYCEHPPKDLVLNVIEVYESKGKKIAYKEAEGMVPIDCILKRISDEVNERWGGYLKKENSQGCRFFEKVKPSIEKSMGTIIDKDLWMKVNTILCEENSPKNDSSEDYNMKL